MSSETRYTQSGDVVPGFISHLEQDSEDPSYARFLGHLASFCRLIRLDKRGTGLYPTG